MRNNGWIDMDPQDRFDEADKRIRRMIDRRAYLTKREAPQDWIAHYDEALVYAINERNRWQDEANDMANAQRRREYERLDIYGR